MKSTQVMDDEQKARSRDDRVPEFGKMSLGEVALALESHLLAPEASQQRLWQTSLCCAAASSGRRCRQTFSPFRSRPTAAELSLSLEVGRVQLGQAEEEEAMVKQLLGHGQHLSVFTLCWIQALSTVLCHDQFVCWVAPARLFACDEKKRMRLMSRVTEGLIAYFAQLGDRDELHPPRIFSRAACEHGTSGAGVGVWGVRAPVLLFGG